MSGCDSVGHILVGRAETVEDAVTEDYVESDGR